MKLPSSSATELNKKNLEHMVSMKDFSVEEMDNMMELMTHLKQARKDNAIPPLFKGKSVGMIFEAGSTRTRVSFEVAATLLGGHALFLSPKDIHLGGKESIDDTSRVLSRMCDIIMARTNSPETLDGLLKMSTVPVINGLDTRFHPTQMLADLYTIREHITDGRKLSDLTLAFMGDATDVCRSLMLTCAKYGMGFKQIGPKKYHMEQEWIDMALNFCEESGGTIEITDDVERISDCDVVYGDSFYWVTQMDEKEERLAAFMPNYVITEELMAKARPGAMLLHCLPANDKEEVTRGALESEYSVAFDEAENRLTAQMAILVYFTHKDAVIPTQETVKHHEEKISSFLSTL
ncbi:ornithine carbamoyltransferase [Vibrio splendidus]|uniref:Ornithine carbamoyltransferase n=1 Tax=Vibrio splendidus TaxID=29497 RepID=A0A2N7FER2_VIBSP|nr:ornithine carbamoyltransferase [Vibrio splendidus]PMH07788.1 ornithine carbamoyltransferase [Vibrio splendidus]PMI70806.1 ornithine carbamoyltransferase [Vibrio splendidus]PMJ67781.1 ornithine carbamoyltransferase [Vibrio splendidus]PMJ93726.1 ornithine carbamoyltransferase [Vibrio splendidus]PMK61118.1 ornithine carbamoyltransferase [Vibrio splendidus]|tara:strand:- start:210 stop:1256 length:1047 start_codon:yes stop_codon:yes gene_type:complete